jgi:hypothetical protein
MNEKDSFIIEDLDDFHLLIKADEEYRVRRQLETEVTNLLVNSTVRCSLLLNSLRRIHIV